MSTLFLLLESLCMAGVISCAFERKKEAFIFISFFIGFINVFLLDTHYLWFLYLLMITLEWFLNKKMDILLPAQIVLACLIQSLTKLVALLIVSLVSKLPIMVLAYNVESNVTIQLMIIGLFVIISTIIYHYSINVKQRTYSNALGVLFCVIYYIVDGFLSALIYGSITLDDIQRFSIAFICFCGVLIYIIYLMNKENELELVTQKETIVKDNLMMIEGIQSNIHDLEHRMNYVLLSLKHFILQNEKKEALKMIQEYTWNLNKISYFTNTGNPYFDQVFSNIMKRYILKDIKPACVLEIPHQSIDHHLSFVWIIKDVLSKLIEILNKDQTISITLQAKQQLFLFSVIIQNISKDEICLELPKDSSIQMIDERTIQIKILYEMK